MNSHKYSLEQLQEAIKHFNLDTSHFIGQAWNKSKMLDIKVSTEDYLSNIKPIQSFKLISIKT